MPGSLTEHVGYLRRSRCRAYDQTGLPHDVVECYIQGQRHAVRRSDLAAAVAGRDVVRVESLTRWWNLYFGVTTGFAQLSRSGRAFNISLFNGGRFPVALGSLQRVIDGDEDHAVIMQIPRHPFPRPVKMRRIPLDQQRIFATV